MNMAYIFCFGGGERNSEVVESCGIFFFFLFVITSKKFASHTVFHYEVEVILTLEAMIKRHNKRVIRGS